MPNLAKIPFPVHNCHFIAELESRFLIVGNIQNRRSDISLNDTYFLKHLFTKFRVKIRNRFIHNDNIITAHQSSCDGHTLLLAAGKLARQVLFIPHHAYLLQSMARFFRHFRLIHAHLFHWIKNILKHRHMRPYGIVLKYDANMPIFRRHIDFFLRAEQTFISHIDRPGLRLNETEQTTHQCSLAAA